MTTEESISLTKKIITLGIIGLAAETLEAVEVEQKRLKRKRKWVRNWIERRTSSSLGSIALVHNELAFKDEMPYKIFLRMDQTTFGKLLVLVGPRITKQDTHLRKSISARDRLTVTLRFLASGSSYKNLEYSMRMPACTIAKIVPECCIAIYSVLREEYLKVPSTEESWKSLADIFFKLWNFPNCLGALDGKHIKFEAPKSAGSIYWNYKQYNSLVLLALVDASYNFLYVDVGTNGRVNDGGVFRESDVNTALINNSLKIPPSCALPNTNTKLPYVILADGAFPLQRNIMKPFPQKDLTLQKRIYNYRLSRGRRVLENAFGHIACRFRVLLTTIKFSPSKVEGIVLTCCALHNFLRKESNGYFTSDCVDREDETGQIIPGSWRSTVSDNLPALRNKNGRPTWNAVAVRQQFMNYFNGIGQVPWQNNYA